MKVIGLDAAIIHANQSVSKTAISVRLRDTLYAEAENISIITNAMRQYRQEQHQHARQHVQAHAHHHQNQDQDTAERGPHRRHRRAAAPHQPLEAHPEREHQHRRHRHHHQPLGRQRQVMQHRRHRDLAYVHHRESRHADNDRGAHAFADAVPIQRIRQRNDTDMIRPATKNHEIWISPTTTGTNDAGSAAVSGIAAISAAPSISRPIHAPGPGRSSPNPAPSLHKRGPAAPAGSRR